MVHLDEARGVIRALLGLDRLGPRRFLRALCHPRIVFRRAPARWGALRQAAHPWWHVGHVLSRRLASGATAQHQAGARQDNWPKHYLARHDARMLHDCGLKPVNSGQPYHPICEYRRGGGSSVAQVDCDHDARSVVLDWQRADGICGKIGSIQWIERRTARNAENEWPRLSPSPAKPTFNV